MSDDNLTPVQRYVLVILMAEGRKVPNTHLEKVRKLSWKKKEHRDPMVDDGLIAAHQERKGGPFSVELTEKGWRRAIAELTAEVPQGGGSPAAALYTVLDRLTQFLDRRGDLSIQDIFGAPEDAPEDAPRESSDDLSDTTPADLETRIRKAYAEVVQQPGGWVMLARVRGALGPVPRTEVDATLVRMSQQPGVRLIPESNQKVLTPEQRTAAVRIGNEDKHLIALES